MVRQIFIIIPAYNEEENIVKLLTDVKDLEVKYPKKVIVVDDGSSDKTLELANKFRNRMNLEIVVHSKNLGVPRTFYDGLYAAAKKASSEDIIFIIEGDNTSDLRVLSKIANKIEGGSDIVIASRHRVGGLYKNFPLHRKYGSMFINYILKTFFYIKGIMDYTIFYRGYKADVVQKAMKKYGEKFITTKSFAANLEILVKMRPFAKKCDEVPLIYDYGLKKGKTKMKIAKTLFEYKDLILKRISGKL